MAAMGSFEKEHSIGIELSGSVSNLWLRNE